MNNISDISFKGYDVMPMKALYMQGLSNKNERNIFREMKRVAQEEGVDLFINNDNSVFSRELPSTNLKTGLSIWAQDVKTFIMNKANKQVLWDSNDFCMYQKDMAPLDDFKIRRSKNLPRGGNFYIGYNDSGEKWLMINDSLVHNTLFWTKDFGVSEDKLVDLYDVKKENIIPLPMQFDDLDEVVRPIGYPYVLVNDYKESYKLLELMKEKYPKSLDTYTILKKFLDDKLATPKIASQCDEVCKILEENGFKPIRIGGRFSYGINYMNAIAFENKEGNITYITNSTRGSYTELEYLEKLFDEQLRNNVNNVSRTYYISGGKREKKDSGSFIQLYARGLPNRNGIMDILANRDGGIHCMTAEVPDFDKIK